MRAATSLLAVAVLLSASGCGAGQPVSPEASAVTTTAPRSGGSWGVDIAQGRRSPGEPTLVERLDVFHEKRTARDAFDSMIPSLSESDTAEGRELSGQSRLLIARIGDQSLFGVPTENGWVCPHFVYLDGEEGDGGPCWSTLRDGVSFSLEGDDHFYQLYGVAANNVASVTVIVAGKQASTEMGRNSFVFGAKPVAICPTDLKRLVIAYKGGGTSAIDLATVSNLPSTSGAILGCR
jgi:hypothetical protein